MAKNTWAILVFLCATLPLWGQVENPDKPLKGNWDFKPAKEIEIIQAGRDVFAEPTRMLVSDEGYLYVHDEKNKANYIFDRAGRFLKTFGGRGEGPGEVRTQSASFLVGDKLVAVDVGRIHYFTQDGTYLRSEVNNVYRHRPVCFLNENEFIAFPVGFFEAPDGKAEVTRYNLKTKKTTVITPFTIFTGGTGEAGGLVGSLIVTGLTPLMTVGLGTDRLYYGMSDVYVIHIADFDGKVVDSFSLDRKKHKVSENDKRSYFDRHSGMRRQALDQIIETTPNEATYFSRIEEHGGLIYVFIPDIQRRHRQQIDIFSLKGEYLYRGEIKIEENIQMLRPQIHNPVIMGHRLYVSVLDEQDEVKIHIYQISLPKL